MLGVSPNPWPMYLLPGWLSMPDWRCEATWPWIFYQVGSQYESPIQEATGWKPEGICNSQNIWQKKIKLLLSKEVRPSSLDKKTPSSTNTSKKWRLAGTQRLYRGCVCSFASVQSGNFKIGSLYHGLYKLVLCTVNKKNLYKTKSAWMHVILSKIIVHLTICSSCSK